MAAPRHYLDYNATAPLAPAARAAMSAALDLANPSSVHFEGRAARAALELAREQVAALVGGEAKNVTFTSGGTEAANLALTPDIHVEPQKTPFDRLAISAVEHACILSGHRFAPDRVTLLPVEDSGQLSLPALETWLASAPGRPVLALQYANNETGVIQPVSKAAELIHKAGGILICDAVQAAGKVPLSFDCGADIILLSAHKFGGPKGAGALITASDAIQIEAPLLRGGGQEKSRRAGTQNVAACVGFGAAAANPAPIPDLRTAFETVLRQYAPQAVIFAQNAPRLPNTLCFALPGFKAENLLIAFDLAGVALSSGSACSSGKVKASHVLLAMNVPDALCAAALRLSFGWATTGADLAAFEKALARIVCNRPSVHAPPP